MLAWMRKRRSTAPSEPEPATDPAESRRSATTGKYVSLYKYLNGRFANVAVLTFAEIEDLLGFALPGQARLHQEWWTDAEINRGGTSYSDSWILAGRTAVPNMAAHTVVFDARNATLALNSPTNPTLRASQFSADGTLDPTRLTPAQAEYLALPVEGPFKQDDYRY